MRCEPVEMTNGRAGALACVSCGCTEDNPCENGCYWISFDPPVCSTCEATAQGVLEREPLLPGLFGSERCPKSPVGGPHDRLWVDEASGYCVRCRAGFAC